MSDESKTPNDPNTPQNTSKASSDSVNTNSQVDIANELNKVLSEVSNRIIKSVEEQTGAKLRS